MRRLPGMGTDRKFSVTFDDTAEGRVRLFADGALTREVHFDTYGQALQHIDALREAGFMPQTPNVEAIETLLRTAELYHLKAMGRDEKGDYT